MRGTRHNEQVRGRPPKPISESEIREQLLAGTPLQAIAKHYDVSVKTLDRRIKKARAEHGPGWGVPLKPPGPPPGAPDPNDRVAMAAWTMSNLVCVASAPDNKPADAIKANELIRKSLKLDDLMVQDDDERGTFSRQDAADIRAVRRRLSFWIGQAIQRRIKRHAECPSEDPDARDRDQRLVDAWVPVARAEASDEQKQVLAAVLAEYGDPCSI